MLRSRLLILGICFGTSMSVGVTDLLVNQIEFLTGAGKQKIVLGDGWRKDDLDTVCGLEGCYFINDLKSRDETMTTRNINIFISGSNLRNIDVRDIEEKCGPTALCFVTFIRRSTQPRIQLGEKTRFIILDVVLTNSGFSMNIDCGHTLHMNVAFNLITIKRNKSASKTAGVECLNKKVNFRVAFNKIAPYVHIYDDPTKMGGPEPSIMQVFAKKEGLNLEWVNANFAWGLISPETGLWIGTIGKVLYGEVSAGITNVDITYTRYKVVDYTSPISINRGIILSKKPGPASSIFNVVKVFDPLVWSLIIVGLFTSFALLFVFHSVEVEGYQGYDENLLFFNLLGQLVRQPVQMNLPRWMEVLVVSFSIFGLFIGFFYESLILSTLVSVPYEKPINSLKDIIERGSRVYICQGGTYEAFFRDSTEETPKKIYEMATSSSKYNGIVPCSVEEQRRQSEEMVNNGAVRIVASTMGLSVFQDYYDRNSVQPFRMGQDKIFHFYVGIPVRKDAQWKDSLDSVINQLWAGGLLSKWFNDEFNSKIFLKTTDDDSAPLKMEYFWFPTIILFSGVILGLTAFLVELNKTKNKSNKKKNLNE
ncbi:glutamate receptor 1 isoform X2 [Eurytemora carolleeae]|uniref:glutamate receptor 1 isoform X2 n=1 Tax=Eurytemora carolleeae TaxID=1294199 RepID=UPI000C762759|nr:glutamate receptor 1 isoform X2 [Eurytemora carolleeae]|eukprot:XP_023339551.1 glutamate receptor 1-like isoform X2 [Eurytemora affinis]